MTIQEKKVGGCRIERVLSRSEHSILYRAYSDELARPVMIKLLDPLFPESSRTTRRFLRGGELASSLEHTNIVQTFAAGKEHKVIFMLMEFLEGHSLDKVLTVHKQIKYQAACDIIRQVAQALEYAASRNVIHRGIEPSHIFLSPGGKVSMLGFGLARLSESQDMAITAEGALVGIGAYSCPESGFGVQDIRGDLYSLGATFYHMLAGRPPFSGRDALEYLHKHRTDPPWPVRDLADSNLPEAVEQIVHGLLEKNIDKRIQTPQELIACLDAVLQPDLVGSPAADFKGNNTVVINTREILALRGQTTVLICDDQVYNISLIHEVLHRLGFKTLTTRDGRAAIGAATENKIDLLITDTKLPGIQGQQLIEEILRRHSCIPVILSRGGKQAALMRRNSSNNIITYLERPLDPQQVREAAQKALKT